MAYRSATRAVFLFGFAKSDRANISNADLQALRLIGANWLAAPSEALANALADGDLEEIEE